MAAAQIARHAAACLYAAGYRSSGELAKPFINQTTVFLKDRDVSVEGITAAIKHLAQLVGRANIKPAPHMPKEFLIASIASIHGVEVRYYEAYDLCGDIVRRIDVCHSPT